MLASVEMYWENGYMHSPAGIISLKHESSIFRSFIQPCLWFWKCQTSYPWDKKYRVPSWRNHIQGLDDLNMLLSCFREKMSGEALANRRQFIQGCFGGGTNVRPSISCIVSADQRYQESWSWAMFGFLFSWIKGQWGPKISCTKTQKLSNSGFLIPLPLLH